MDCRDRRNQLLAMLLADAPAIERANDPGYDQGGTRTYRRDPAGTSTGGQFTRNPAAAQSSQLTYRRTEGDVGRKPSSGRVSAKAGLPASSKFKTLTAGGDNDPAAVRDLQQLLAGLGFGNLQANGQYDEATQHAVMEVQRRLGVKKPNGQATRALVSKLLTAHDLSPCVKRSEDLDPDELERGSRRPYPGQKFRHGWIPTTYALALRWHKNLEGFDDLVEALDSGEDRRFPLAGGINGDVHLVDHNNGTTTIEKRPLDMSAAFGHGWTPERQADAEQLAGTLGRSIEAPVPRVLRTGPDKVTMDVLDGDRWSEVEHEALATGDPTDEATLAAVLDHVKATNEGVRLGVFDLLSDNFDRGNGNNWVVDDHGRPGGFDHAFAWSGVTRAGPQDPPEHEELSPFSEPFTREENGHRVWADNPLTPADVEFLRTHLADLEDEFDALGHHDWYEFAVARLEAIAPYARGTEPIFT